MNIGRPAIHFVLILGAAVLCGQAEGRGGVPSENYSRPAPPNYWDRGPNPIICGRAGPLNFAQVRTPDPAAAVLSIKKLQSRFLAVDVDPKCAHYSEFTPQGYKVGSSYYFINIWVPNSNIAAFEAEVDARFPGVVWNNQALMFGGVDKDAYERWKLLVGELTKYQAVFRHTPALRGLIGAEVDYWAPMAAAYHETEKKGYVRLLVYTPQP